MTPDNPYGPFDAGGGDTIKCPYCAEPDFDAPGLKSHLLAGDCEVWDSTETLTRVFSFTQETPAGHWVCAKCELTNDPIFRVCHGCDAPRPTANR